METGIDRFLADQHIDTASFYTPYPKQYEYHAAPHTYKCLGGAAGPGKTLAIIMDHMEECQSFGGDRQIAEQVHTLMLRRTFPKLEATLITRFKEKVPKELYQDFNETKKIVTWRNGSTSRFGSMQREKDWEGYQGQWLKVSYDEMAEFTFKQWYGISAWNRCPVSKYATKDGATNPIGVGATWIRALFVDKKPYDQMDKAQRDAYDPKDYGYFPCTYLDNPIYANDPTFLAQLASYPAAIQKALKEGSWDIVGGYFQGAYDPAENVISRLAAYEDLKPWTKRWISGDWGFSEEHPNAIYWHYKDDWGVVRTYREVLVTSKSPADLAHIIVSESADPDGSMPKFISFPFSHDAFHSTNTKTFGSDPTPVATRMGHILDEAGLPRPFNAGKNKVGREQGMYNELRREVFCGNDAEGKPIMRRAWEISEDCPRLLATLATAPRDEDKPDQIAQYIGDDPLAGAGHGIQWIVAPPGQPTAGDKLRMQIMNPATTAEQKHWLRLKETKRREAKQASKEGDYWS